jgi:hypothetical protein
LWIDFQGLAGFDGLESMILELAKRKRGNVEDRTKA